MVVQHVLDQNNSMVTKNDVGKYNCTCTLVGKCYHNLAIQHHNMESVDEKGFTYKFSAIEKTRSNPRQSGRKSGFTNVKPRILEFDTSILAEKKMGML